MRIGFYLSHYPAPGGTTTAVGGLARALARAGHDVVVFATGAERRAFGEGGVDVAIFRRRTRRAPFVVPPRLVREIASNGRRLDLLVLNGQFHRDLPALALAAVRARLPYVVAPHGPYHPQLLAKHGGRKRVYLALVERRLLRHAAAIQVLATGQEEFLRTLGVDRPAICVPNGCDEAVALRNRARGAVTTLGYLGRLDTWHKGLDLLLDAFAQLRPAERGLRLILQGPDWGGEASLRARASSLGLDGAVEFRGRVPRAADAIGEWDAFVLPSRYDGFALSALDAMLAARPLLCSTEAGVAEHVARAGAGVVAEPTVSDIALGLERLLARRDEWHAMGDRGRAYARTHLTWDRIADEAAREYTALLTGLADRRARLRQPAEVQA
jgi:glycosyltransferase involved in cell wall biosynthesis